MSELPFSTLFKNRRKVIFAGAMGSGKTEIAINFACYWSIASGHRPGLIDFDMVKPCFRLRSVTESIDTEKVELVVPDCKYGFADFPIIPPSMEAYIIDPNRPAVIDVGGDEVGARLLGKFHGRLHQKDVDFWYVYNGMRPLSRGSDDVLEIMNGVEQASRLKLTGLVHNSHLMNESSVDVLLSNIERAENFAREKGIPIVFHCIREDLFEEAAKTLDKNILLPLKLHVSLEWM